MKVNMWGYSQKAILIFQGNKGPELGRNGKVAWKRKRQMRELLKTESVSFGNTLDVG